MVKDETGNVHGMLTVIKRASNRGKEVYWECLCSCGNTTEVGGYNLRKGLTQSCGCLHRARASANGKKYAGIPRGARVDRTGCRYGLLTVLGRADNIVSRSGSVVGATAWICECDCGVRIVRTTATLHHKGVHSCGCYKNALASKNLEDYRRASTNGARFIDYTGRRYYRLLVLGRYPENLKNRTTWIVVCDCGTFKTVCREALDIGKTKSCGCFRKEDSREKMAKLRPMQVGSANPAWNPNLTPEDRVDRRSLVENKEWSLAVKVRDSFTCQVCLVLRGELNSHHLDSYRAHPERRYDLSNGVTLCRSCHSDFHSKYGSKVTYEWQFREYEKLHSAYQQAA